MLFVGKVNQVDFLKQNYVVGDAIIIIDMFRISSGRPSHNKLIFDVSINFIICLTSNFNITTHNIMI